MSDSEADDLDFLSYSGSEYEPSSSGQDSDASLSDASENSDTQGNPRKKKRQCRNEDERKRQGAGVIERRPFGEMLRGVVLCISGVVNPERADMRRRALEMGAAYRPDWDSSCTHLICAFRDTPKYNQVRGRGKIVKKEWIDDCHSSRKRFPWRRYALDRRDENRNESEDEIHELLPDADTSTVDDPSTSTNS